MNHIEEILIATGNQGKVREIGQIFSDTPLRLRSLRDIWDTIPEIPETGATFFDNARMKARWVLGRTGAWCLADDSGLEVDALGGEPGVRSARFAGEHGNDTANNAKLLRCLQNVEVEKRTARFRCVVVLAGPEGEYSAEGVCEGRIGFGPRGSEGFGYDPLFIPDGFSETFAQLDADRKHAVSHRGRALQALRERIRERI
ncbi:MAG: RdgB/HAM1 family non-canonical purine NTP pyrophosphatase [Chitinivibrionales bacterium]|nr:RdgB/HAM1 family non-canonical purine NTP pyrophosphatase [Chitinivibrionales bacterium]MBD3395122.1 RdgB/HAM1 family non-canonical purine NTP pyrophosphatase [Chitinivibrionales bacterium]